MALTLEPISDEFQLALLGKTDVFPWRLVQHPWVTFQCDNWRQPTVYHGLLFSQLHKLLEEGVWRCGLWNGVSQSSPFALWVATSRSMAIDRAQAKRGYAASNRWSIPNGWDCPCAIGFDLPHSWFGGHERLANGVQLMRMLPHGSTEIPLAELNIVEVTAYHPVYIRLQGLHTKWLDIKRSRLLMCRCDEGNPHNFWKSGHGKSWSCIKTIEKERALAAGWKKARKTKEWRCPECDYNWNNSLGSFTGEV